MPGKTMAASTPMTMITIMSSTIVNPPWRFIGSSHLAHCFPLAPEEQLGAQ